MSCSSIIIVEDDASFREMLKLILELDGYKVLTASNGEEGLAVLKAQKDDERPCLILLDLMMPVMNGWQFVEALGGVNATLATIPVVVVTAFGDQAKTLNSSGVLKKPIEIDELYSMVRRYCYPARNEAASGSVEPP